MAIHRLAGLQAEGLGAWAPPAAGWLSPGFAGLNVIARRVLDRAAVDLLPDVVKVVAFAQGCHHCHYASRLHEPEATELPIHI